MKIYLIKNLISYINARKINGDGDKTSNKHYIGQTRVNIGIEIQRRTKEYQADNFRTAHTSHRPQGKLKMFIKKL